VREKARERGKEREKESRTDGERNRGRVRKGGREVSYSNRAENIIYMIYHDISYLICSALFKKRKNSTNTRAVMRMHVRIEKLRQIRRFSKPVKPLKPLNAESSKRTVFLGGIHIKGGG
jgi:hypothetical protein